MKRQLWWNFRPEPQEERVQYFFVIINDSREIGSISSRIIEQLSMVDEMQERDGKAGDLSYKLMVFFSEKRLTNWKLDKIYEGDKKRNFRLYERERTGMDGLEAYIQSEIEKNN
jgi:hypothetical protein